VVLAQQTTDTRRYTRFRKSVFESGDRYSQQLSNIHIEQHGDLAQVSLDFVTKNLTTGSSGFGWKALLLLKVRGQWRIASELYTVHDAAEMSGASCATSEPCARN
jgi:hypothetical protein